MTQDVDLEVRYLISFVYQTVYLPIYHHGNYASLECISQFKASIQLSITSADLQRVAHFKCFLYLLSGNTGGNITRF